MAKRLTEQQAVSINNIKNISKADFDKMVTVIQAGNKTTKAFIKFAQSLSIKDAKFSADLMTIESNLVNSTVHSVYKKDAIARVKEATPVVKLIQNVLQFVDRLITDRNYSKFVEWIEVSSPMFALLQAQQPPQNKN